MGKNQEANFTMFFLKKKNLIAYIFSINFSRSFIDYGGGEGYVVSLTNHFIFVPFYLIDSCNFESKADTNTQFSSLF